MLLRRIALAATANGVTASTESLLCDEAAQTSSVALILRVASETPRDATRRMRRPTFIFPRVDLSFNGRGPQS